MLVISDRLKVPLRELHFSFVRSSGPGGQNVNKVATKAVLRWRVMVSATLPQAVRERVIARNRRRMNRDGDLVVTSQRFRDQGRNVADCLAKLRRIVADAAAVPKTRRPTRPTRASQTRRVAEKRTHSAKKRLRRRPPQED